MTLTFYNVYEQINNSELIEKKLLVKNIYSKFYIRYLSRNRAYIDNSIRIEQIDLTPSFYQAFFKKKRSINGRAINLKINLYQHTKNHQIGFIVPGIMFSGELKNKIESWSNLGKSYALIRRVKNSFTRLFYGYPKKGGFIMYNQRGSGFMPYSHYKLFYRTNCSQIYSNNILRAVNKELSQFMLYFFRGCVSASSLKFRVDFNNKEFKYKQKTFYKHYRQTRMDSSGPQKGYLPYYMKFNTVFLSDSALLEKYNKRPFIFNKRKRMTRKELKRMKEKYQFYLARLRSLSKSLKKDKKDKTDEKNNSNT